MKNKQKFSLDRKIIQKLKVKLKSSMVEWSKQLRSCRSIESHICQRKGFCNILVSLANHTNCDYWQFKGLEGFATCGTNKNVPRIENYLKFLKVCSNGRMAEWSKALRSVRSIKASVCSNPTPVKEKLYLIF